MHQPVLIVTKDYSGGLAKKIYHRTETTSTRFMLSVLHDIITNGMTTLNTWFCFLAYGDKSCDLSPLCC